MSMVRRDAPAASSVAAARASPARIGDAEKPDYIFILPWNLKDEIMKQLAHARAWGAQFIVPIPEPQIIG